MSWCHITIFLGHWAVHPIGVHWGHDQESLSSYLQCQIVFFLAFFDLQTQMSLQSKVNRAVHTIDNQGNVVLRLQGSGL